MVSKFQFKMHSKLILVLIAFILCFTHDNLLAQTSDSTQNTVDTLVFYRINYSLTRQNGERIYKINDKVVSKAAFDTIASANRRKQECNPCYALTKNAENMLISEGIYYHDCNGKNGLEKKEVIIETETIKQKKVQITTNSCRDGKWLFYHETAKPEEKYYDMGEEIKKPKG